MSDDVLRVFLDKKWSQRKMSEFCFVPRGRLKDLPCYWKKNPQFALWRIFHIQRPRLTFFAGPDIYSLLRWFLGRVQHFLMFASWCPYCFQTHPPLFFWHIFKSSHIFPEKSTSCSWLHHLLPASVTFSKGENSQFRKKTADSADIFRPCWPHIFFFHEDVYPWVIWWWSWPPFFFGTMTFSFFLGKKQAPSFSCGKIAELLLPLCVVVRYSLALMVMVASGHLILSRQNPIEPLWITYYVSRWWFQRFFIFTPIRGKWSNLTNIFFKWVVQPPTRFLWPWTLTTCNLAFFKKLV